MSSHPCHMLLLLLINDHTPLKQEVLTIGIMLDTTNLTNPTKSFWTSLQNKSIHFSAPLSTLNADFVTNQFDSAAYNPKRSIYCLRILKISKFVTIIIITLSKLRKWGWLSSLSPAAELENGPPKTVTWHYYAGKSTLARGTPGSKVVTSCPRLWLWILFAAQSTFSKYTQPQSTMIFSSHTISSSKSVP